ncbi:MAG: cytochrome c peroxidase, partial [Pseudomonadota bacterium]
WSQALVPFEAADEMGGSRMEVVRHVGENNNLRILYENIFGSFPLELLNNNLPVRAGPMGNQQTQDNWFTLSSELQKTINQVYSNIGKAIAAYEITLIPYKTRFDRYVDVIFQKSFSSEKNNTFSKNEIAGLKLFINSEKTQCLQCHNGPLFTNGGFHNIGTGKFIGESLDFGRMLGLQAVLIDEFNCLGSFSDALAKDCSNLRFLNKSSHIPLQGAYKTPSLRYTQRTAPYMHDGRFKTLNDVMQHYNNPPEDNGVHELRRLQLSKEELENLVAFIKTLSDF